jgi:hypothetical protein
LHGTGVVYLRWIKSITLTRSRVCFSKILRLQCCTSVRRLSAPCEGDSSADVVGPKPPLVDPAQCCGAARRNGHSCPAQHFQSANDGRAGQAVSSRFLSKVRFHFSVHRNVPQNISDVHSAIK